MIHWVHDLPLAWLVVVVFAATPGILPPMGLAFGLLVGFAGADRASPSGRPYEGGLSTGSRAGTSPCGLRSIITTRVAP